MFFGKSYWKTTEQGIQKEWLLTNGIGGFAGGTIIGMNARRYHGLLIASLTPPVDRFLVLSQIHEDIITDNQEYHLGTFKTHDYTAHGEYYLEGFQNEYIPEFRYRVGSIFISKRICLRHMKNQVAVVYHIKNHHKKTTIRLIPLVNFRNYHYLSYSKNMPFNAAIGSKSIEITPYNMGEKILVECSDGAAVLKKQCYFYNMDYPYEHERGLSCTEDHYIPGFFEIELQPGKEKVITVVASIGDPIDVLDGEHLIEQEILRQKVLVKGLDSDKFREQLTLSADKFIVYRKSTDSKSIIAGYPWFTDWGRDTMISLTGLTLAANRFDDARDILSTFAHYEKDGLIPNVFSDTGGEPAYNTVDAALWYFEAVYKYIKYTGDLNYVVKNLLPVLKRIINGYKEGTHFDIKMDKDGLISAGNDETQLTWMDAKAGNWVVTPRHGKAVEINALWYNALLVINYILNEAGKNTETYAKLAEKAKKSFIKLFWNENSNCLYDVINNEEKDGKIRPNQVLAVSLSFPVIEGEMAKSVVDTVYSELYTALGLRTLNQKAGEYKGIYIGNQYMRDGAYHQGTVWTWPLGQFITAYARVYKGDSNIIKKLKEFFLPFEDHLKDSCIGSISEIFDGNEPLIPRGCCAQAWSVSEILRSYVEDYLPLKDNNIEQ